MKYIVVFNYMDGEQFELEVDPADMENLMAAVGQSEVFFNKSRGIGVWVPIDKIRYFHVERVGEDGKRIRIEEHTVEHEEVKEA